MWLLPIPTASFPYLRSLLKIRVAQSRLNIHYIIHKITGYRSGLYGQSSSQFENTYRTVTEPLTLVQVISRLDPALLSWLQYDHYPTFSCTAQKSSGEQCSRLRFQGCGGIHGRGP